MSDYEKLQRDAARRFLQTCLVVDDRASTAPPSEPTPEDVGSAAAPSGPKSPSPNTTTGEDSRPASQDKAAEHATADRDVRDDQFSDEERAADDRASVVDVKRLADCFADLGLTCGVLKPEGERHAEVTDRIVRAARGVDIVVLDWILEERRFTAEDAILKIVSEDGYGHRLLAVYTTHRKLGEISDRLLEKIEGAEPVKGDELMFDARGTRIAIFHKGGPKLDPSYAAYEVSQDDLPEALVDVFAKQTAGLVPAVALNALAATRDNTHRLLGRLHQGLDLGYLGHLLRLESRSDGEQHLLDAISGELRALIEDDKDTRNAASEGFGAWLDAHADRLQAPAAALGELAAKLHDGGYGEWRDAHLDGTNVGRTQVTTLLVEDGRLGSALESDARFAQLLAMRRPYSRADPLLTLGVIAHEADEPGNYWLCIHPACDSVRLPEDAPTNFLMLPLQGVEDGEKTAFVVDAPDGSPLRLWLWKHTSDLELMRVLPTEDRMVRFSADEGDGDGKGGPKTVATEDGVTLVWVAQLKPAHALRVAHEYGTALSRVGLDESEWLRNLATRGKDTDRVRRRSMVERARVDDTIS